MDKNYMLLALRLAARGIGTVEPNPAVGSVIVKGDKIIGKGWHKKFGGPHAEINALEDCRNKGNNPEGTTMYVTLEPCCHQGKTGPCTDAIIAAKPAKIVAATIDPSAHANGKGIEKLKNAGIDVQVGVCEKQAKLLNAPFMKFAATGRCWVILKWAQSIDGKLAYADAVKDGEWISCEQSRKDAHRLRRRVQGILVGIETVLADNPLLTPRPSRGRQPTRIVLDSNLRISLNSRLLVTAKKSPVIVVTSKGAVEANLLLAEKITQKGAKILTVPVAEGRCDIGFLLNELAKDGISQLLVEGGAKVLSSFLKERLADEICVYIAPKILGARGSTNISEALAELTKALTLHYVDIKRLGDDVRITGFLQISVC